LTKSNLESKTVALVKSVTRVRAQAQRRFMTVKIGINGFGRIGRCVLRALENHKGLEVVHINDLTNAATLAHLYKYDSVHGTAKTPVDHKENAIVVGGKTIAITAIQNPAEIPWAQAQVDVVLECTGRFTKGEECAAHLRAGAKKVILSAPGKSVDKTLVLGVNHHEYDASKHNIVSNGSCTTNCLAPVAKVVHEAFGIKKGLMTTIHSYTNDQRILDLPHSDLRRARAAALSMIPTSTGAAKAISEVIPALAGKMHGISVRVPTPNVSLVDVTFELGRKVNASEVNDALQKAANGPLKGILGFSTEPLVSTDFNGNPMSSIVDAEYTTVIDDTMIKILSWYDNEWGFSNRLIELSKLLMGK
jgi:glyceraldehyde 3-phosphate dehydrogenase